MLDGIQVLQLLMEGSVGFLEARHYCGCIAVADGGLTFFLFGCEDLLTESLLSFSRPCNESECVAVVILSEFKYASLEFGCYGRDA